MTTPMLLFILALYTYFIHIDERKSKKREMLELKLEENNIIFINRS